MKREIYIQVIKDYILENPHRPTSQVREYATEVNATNDELQEAIARAQAVLNKEAQAASLLPKLAPHKAKKSFKMPAIAFGAIPAIALQGIAAISLTGVLILSAASLFLFTKINAISQQLNSSTTALSSVSSESGLISTLAPPVYANQKSVSAAEIFSFPAASPVTLKYKGIINGDIFGFFPYWMIEKHDQIDTTGYTDVALFGLTTDAKGNILTAINGEADQGWKMWNAPELDTFLARLKRQKTRVHLVIKSFNNDDIESITGSNENQARLIANAVALMNAKSLDGINIDFEYVGTPSSKGSENFTRFIGNLNAEMKRQNPEAMLTVDTYVSSAADSKFFDITSLAQHVDSFVIMGYDVHTPSGDPGPVSPLDGTSGLIGYLQSYLERVSPDKLILALPYYGYDWALDGEGKRNQNIQSRILPYAVIAQASKGSKIMWDKTAQTPFYRYRDPDTGVNRIVHFDNSRSLALKYDYIKDKDFKGVGIWAMGYDGLNPELHQTLLDKFAE